MCEEVLWFYKLSLLNDHIYHDRQNTQAYNMQSTVDVNKILTEITSRNLAVYVPFYHPGHTMLAEKTYLLLQSGPGV